MMSRTQEMEVLEHEIRDDERRLRSLERAPREGRWTRGDTEWIDACANQQTRINVMRLHLIGLRLADRLEDELA